MKLRDIAINNLRRRKTKALFLISGLTIGVASIVAMFTSTQILEQDIANKMEEYGANIVITPRTEEIPLSYGGLTLGDVSFDLKDISQNDLDKIKTIKNSNNIRAVSPKVFGVFEKQGKRAVVVGIDFASELILKPWWQISGNLPEGPTEILIGQEAAGRFNLILGSKLEIKGEDLMVSGLLQSTGSQDDNLFFMTLPSVQKLFNKTGKIAMAEVAALCGNCPISEIVSQISEKIPSAKVTAVQQVVQARMDTLMLLRKLCLGISVIVLLVGSMLVFVTMMASVNERTREIGILSAIGFRRSHIMRIILQEVLIVSMTAGVIGYLAGIVGVHFILPLFIEKGSGLMFDPFVAMGAILLSSILGLAASIFPAISASTMEPSEALRTL